MKQIFLHPCSACGEDAFEFLEGSHGDTSYKWVCNSCGIEMGLDFSNGGKQVKQTPTGKRCDRTLALLQMRGRPSFMFIHEGVVWDGALSEQKYFYEKHTCPTNLMRCVEIIDAGEADPHGVFKLIEEHLITGPNAKPREEVLAKLKALAIERTKWIPLDPTSEG